MEELLTTEPGPPKGAKPVNGIAKTIAPPAGAKKKEPTVSEPNSNDGSTQAGLDVSQEPGPKGAKPSGKSTEDNEYTRYFNAYQEKLGKQLEDKLTQEVADYKKQIGFTEPDDSEIKAYNTKVESLNNRFKELGLDKEPDKFNDKEVRKWNQNLLQYQNEQKVLGPEPADKSKEFADYEAKLKDLNAFQDKRAKELDDEFKSTVNTEYDRVVKQAENFDTQINKFEAARSPKEQPVKDLTSTFLGPFGQVPYVRDLINPAVSVLADMIPSAIAARKVTTEPFAETLLREKNELVQAKEGSPFKKSIYQEIERKYNRLNEDRPLTEEERANRLKEREDAYRKHVGDEQFEKEKTLYNVKQVNSALDAFKEMSLQERERQLKTQGIPQSWADANGVKGVIKYGLSSVGEIAGQVPASIATLGASSYFMERADILKEGIEAKAEAQGTTPEKLIASRDFKDVEEIADQYGAFNAALDLVSLGTMVGAVAKKAIGKNILRNVIKNPTLKPIVNGIINVPGKAGVSGVTEGFTEGWQEINTLAASKISGGTAKDYADAIEKFTPEDWDRVEESVRKGTIGGVALAGGGATIAQRARANKLSEIQNERSKRVISPPKVTPIVSPAQVVSEVRTSVKSANDTQGAENAAEKILEATQSPNATEGQPLTTQTDGQERNGQGRQEGLLVQETGEWKAGDIIPANYPQPERVIKSVDADLSDTMVKVTFEDGTKGAIQKKKSAPVVEEKPVEAKQSTPAQAINKYENDEKFTIDDLVDELESSDDPKIQEAVSKYRADVKEGLEVWGGREDSEARETGFINEVRKITGETPQPTPDLTVGDNYVKRDNKWYVKDAEGIERPLISDDPNKTQEEQNTELAQLKELKAQLETETPVKVDLSPTGKSRIAEMEAFSPEGRVRKWLFGGGQLLWDSKSQGEGKPTLKGLKDETGYSNKERQDIKQYVHDTNGVSVEQAAEQLAAQYQDRSPQEYRNAIIEVFSSDPKKWYEQQVRDEDPDYAMQEEQRFEEAGQLNEQIKQLETQEEGVKETNQQLYENERRVNYGSPAAEGQAAGGQVASPGSGSQTQVQPRESIRKNGDANKSKQALEELKSKNLTHVPGLGMGQNQAKGTYISTEDQNRYETEDKKPVKVKVNVQKPFVSEDNVFYDIQREIIQSRFGKEKIEDLTETEADLLAEMVTEHFTTEGFDSIYMPQSETQEGELIVFDRSKVTIMDDARIEYENAVHASTQTTLQLEFVPDAEFLKTDKPIELREKQKKIRKDLARLNQLIKCR